MGLVPSCFVFWGFIKTLRGDIVVHTVLFAMNLKNCAMGKGGPVLF